MYSIYKLFIFLIIMGVCMDVCMVNNYEIGRLYLASLPYNTVVVCMHAVYTKLYTEVVNTTIYHFV